jgi:hypothetical protein
MSYIQLKADTKLKTEDLKRVSKYHKRYTPKLSWK